MKMKNFSKRMMAFVLSLIMILGCMPNITQAEPGAVVVTDPGTASAWEDIMGTNADGSRYAGRVWVDKSVYKDGDTVTLNTQGNEDSTFTADVDTDNGEYFQVVFSALGSSMSSNTTITASRPLDVVLVLDTSTSMTTNSSGKSRLQHMIEAANKLLEDLLTLGDVRISIVSFNLDSETIIGLDKYENGIVLSTNHYTNTSGGGIIYAKDKSGTALGNDSGYTAGTNLQDGIHRGMSILAEAEGTEGRTPVAIVLADGRANRAVNERWYSPSSSYRRSSGDAGIMLSTLLNAAYGKTRAEKNYGTDMTVYGVGIDLSSSSDDYIFLNPGAEGSAGFNASNTDDNVESAWNAFTTWRRGTTTTLQSGNRNWVFDHNWPSSAGVTTAEIAANINYVDDYKDVKSAELGDAFDSIYKELSTGEFNPITDTKTGATGVEDTPLIYVDDIGQYMEIKNIQAVQVFGTVYNVTKNADGTYSLAAGSGVNPTTKEDWNTARDIKINVIENDDGTQQLRVYINQEILPILLDEITTTTVNNVTTNTIKETTYPPLRIYYTVGIDSDVLLPDGTVNGAKIDSEYAYVEDGTVSFYSNAFGQANTINTDGDAYVDEGDAHVGFVPSHENRYYYHQTPQEIFISATNKDGSSIDWDDDMYGVLWDESKYDLTAMTYADARAISDTTRVYTYVTFIRPTGSGDEAEEVTYLVYTTWGALKSAVTYHDKVNDTNLNDGSAIALGQVDATVSAYKAGKDISDSDLIAILGLQSRRVSRLSNMFETKELNNTGTAETSYAPEYNDGAHEDSDVHEHSEVIVWLGNNGKLTLPIGTGIKVTKDVTELAEGASADEAFAIQVLLNMAYSADNAAALTVTDLDGGVLTDREYTIANSEGKILITLNLADGKGAYIYGMPGDIEYTVTEAEHEKYEYAYSGATKTAAGAIVEGVVTNSPIQPGNLYITKEVVHAHGGEVFPTDYEFEFEVTFVDKKGSPIANTKFQLENNYDENLTELTTNASGVMTGKLRHGETVYIKGIPAGATVTVKEVRIPVEYTKTEYRSRNHSGADADNDGVVTIDPHQNATVVVTNTYTPDEVGVDISFTGTKIFDATDMSVDSEFTFKLQEYKNSQWTDVEGKSVTVVRGENTAKSFAFTDLDLEFDEPGVHSYQIIEVKGDNTDITYDRSVYTFSVNVVIDEKGDLKAEVVGHNEKDGSFDVSGDSTNGYNVNTVFTNYYHKTATSIAIKKSIKDKGNSGKTAAGFVIETYNAAVDADGNWIQGSPIRSTVTDAQGEALLDRNYDNDDFAGVTGNTVTYHFIIKEKATGIAGWTYDKTEYRVTVVLTKDDTGVITADFDVVKVAADGTQTDLNVNGDRATIEFANEYDPQDAEVSLNTMVKKRLEGRKMTAGEFTFAIFKNGAASHTSTENALAVGTNDAEGNVTFDPAKLTFSEVGRYEYDFVEIKGDKGGVVYDSTIYDLVVEVADHNGKLEANYYFEDAVEKYVTYKNSYTVKGTEVVIDGIKTLEVRSGHKALKAGEYTFYLYNEAGEKISEAANHADGTFKFDAIKYDAVDIGKTYTYTVKEVAPDGTTDGSYSAGGVKWSGQSITVTVKVVDNGDGTLSTEVTGNGPNNIKFVNTYDTAPVDVTLTGKKYLENRNLKEGEFEFGLFDAAGTQIKSVKNNADGSFEFALNDLGEGNHYYVVKEIVPKEPAKGVYYSAAEYHITINVTDNGTGQMAYTMSVVGPTEPGNTKADIVFTNTYIPESGEISLSGTKIYKGGKALEDDVFSVGLYEGEDLIDTALVKADGSFVFQNLQYDANSVGQTYTYTVKEIIPDGAADNGDGTKTSGNHIYDAAVYTVTVKVTDDDKDGSLEIVKTIKKGDTEAELTFTNTFIPDPITHKLQAKKIYDKGLKGNDFEFTLKSADNQTDVDQTKKNDVSGNIFFDAITFNAAGEYKFKITEKKDGIFSFIKPSEAEYEITITVINTNGVLKVANVAVVNTKNTNESNLEFVNTYVMDGNGEVTLRGTKTLTGDRTTVEEGEFEFGLYDADGKLIESVKNDANGNFAFSTLKYDETEIAVNGQKEITYTIKEIAGDNARYTYDDTVYTVVVTIKDDDKGGIDVSYTINGAAGDEAKVTFANTYKNPAPVTYTPEAKKNYNKPLNGGEFKFKLEGEINGTKIAQEKVNSKDGAIVFDTLSFGEAGTYTFTVKEIDKVLGFIEYSTAEYKVVVKVIDTKGVLSIESVTINEDEEGTIVFTNTYVMDGEDEVILRGTKTLTGGRTQVKADEFQFGLYDANDRLVECVKNDTNGNFAFTAMKFDETDVEIGGQKQLIYTVKEIAGTNPDITYDKTVYIVIITVKDNGQGGVSVSCTIDGKADGKLVFTNKCKEITPTPTPTPTPDGPGVNTGDSSNIFGFMAMAMTALAAIYVTLFVRRRTTK